MVKVKPCRYMKTSLHTHKHIDRSIRVHKSTYFHTYVSYTNVWIFSFAYFHILLLNVYLFIYMYSCMHVCMYAHTYAFTYTVCIKKPLHIRISYVCVCVCLCLCTFVLARARACVRVHDGVCVRKVKRSLCLSIQIGSLCVCVRVCVCGCICVTAIVCACVRACVALHASQYGTFGLCMCEYMCVCARVSLHSNW